MLYDLHAFSFPIASLPLHGQKWALVHKSQEGSCGHILLLAYVPIYHCNSSLSYLGLSVLLTFGLGDDMADPQSLAHIMEGLVPRIAPLINVVI